MVWKVKRDGHPPAALKVLTRTETEPYLRFRAEIEFLRSKPERPGILPILDAQLPAEPIHTSPAWYAMPLAELLPHAARGMSPEKIVAAVREVAETLATLHDEGIYHRDIKPANLFWRDGHALVGDFGLVKYPGKRQVTSEGRVLGPAHFMADEVFTNPTGVAWGPADVYSLAKSLWVLMTNQRYAPGGQIRLDNPPDRLVARVEHGRTGTLDLLIERATARSPTERPTMRGFANELTAWLTPPPPPATPRDVSDLREQALALMAPALRQMEVYARNRRRFEEASADLMRVVETAAAAFREAGFQEVAVGGGSEFIQMAGSEPVPAYNGEMARCVSTGLLGQGRVLWAGVVARWLPGDVTTFRTSHHITSSSTRGLLKVLWQAERRAALGSEEERLGLDALAQEFIAQLRPTIIEFLRV